MTLRRGAASTRSFERMLRWYPSPWRTRYGDEMTALLEDTYAAAGDVPIRHRPGLCRRGERAGRAGRGSLSRRSLKAVAEEAGNLGTVNSAAVLFRQAENAPI